MVVNRYLKLGTRSDQDQVAQIRGGTAARPRSGCRSAIQASCKNPRARALLGPRYRHTNAAPFPITVTPRRSPAAASAARARKRVMTPSLPVPARRPAARSRVRRRVPSPRRGPRRQHRNGPVQSGRDADRARSRIAAGNARSRMSLRARANQSKGYRARQSARPPPTSRASSGQIRIPSWRMVSCGSHSTVPPAATSKVWRWDATLSEVR